MILYAVAVLTLISSLKAPEAGIRISVLTILLALQICLPESVV